MVLVAICSRSMTVKFIKLNWKRFPKQSHARLFFYQDKVSIQGLCNSIWIWISWSGVKIWIPDIPVGVQCWHCLKFYLDTLLSFCPSQTGFLHDGTTIILHYTGFIYTTVMYIASHWLYIFTWPLCILFSHVGYLHDSRA